MNAANIRPCHSIHCRHHDLADGMICEVQAARATPHRHRCPICGTREVCTEAICDRRYILECFNCVEA